MLSAVLTLRLDLPLTLAHAGSVSCVYWLTAASDSPASPGESRLSVRFPDRADGEAAAASAAAAG